MSANEPPADGPVYEAVDLKKEYETNETVRTVIDTARVLEGQARHASVHAAGVIVATVPLDSVVPMCWHEMVSRPSSMTVTRKLAVY